MHVGQTGTRCNFKALIHRAEELPSKCPPRLSLEISRRNLKDTTEPTDLDKANATASWEQEVGIPVTMFAKKKGGFAEKEVKFALKNAENGKTVCKAAIDISEQLSTMEDKLLLKVLLQPKSGLGSKGKNVPLRVTMRFESLADSASADHSIGSPSAKKAKQNAETDDEASYMSDASEANSVCDETEHAGGGNPFGVGKMTPAPQNVSSNPFDAKSQSLNPFGESESPPPASPLPLQRSRSNTEDDATPWYKQGIAKGGGAKALDTKHEELTRTRSSTEVKGSRSSARDRSISRDRSNPWDETTPQVSRKREDSGAGGGGRGRADVVDSEDLLTEMEVLKVRLQTAEEDARGTKRQLDEQKKHFKRLIDVERAKQAEFTGEQERLEQLESDFATLELENEALKMQIESFKAMHADNDKKIDWLESELIVAKVAVAEAAQAGFVKGHRGGIASHTHRSFNLSGGQSARMYS